MAASRRRNHEEDDQPHRHSHRETSAEECKQLQHRSGPVEHQHRHADPERLEAHRDRHHQDGDPHVSFSVSCAGTDIAATVPVSKCSHFAARWDDDKVADGKPPPDDSGVHGQSAPADMPISETVPQSERLAPEAAHPQPEAARPEPEPTADQSPGPVRPDAPVRPPGPPVSPASTAGRKAAKPVWTSHFATWPTHLGNGLVLLGKGLAHLGRWLARLGRRLAHLSEMKPSPLQKLAILGGTCGVECLWSSCIPGQCTGASMRHRVCAGTLPCSGDPRHTLLHRARAQPTLRQSNSKRGLRSSASEEVGSLRRRTAFNSAGPLGEWQ